MIRHHKLSRRTAAQRKTGQAGKARSGFTVVELSVVVIVIIILTSVSAIGATVYLRDGRDTERATKVSLLTEALERYYDKNGEYPPCSTISGSLADASATLDRLDRQTFNAPRAATEETNSVTCGATPPSNSNDIFRYYSVPSVTDSTASLNFRIDYWNEDSSKVETVKSRRQQAV